MHIYILYISKYVFCSIKAIVQQILRLKSQICLVLVFEKMSKFYSKNSENLFSDIVLSGKVKVFPSQQIWFLRRTLDINEQGSKGILKTCCFFHFIIHYWWVQVLQIKESILVNAKTVLELKSSPILLLFYFLIFSPFFEAF